MNPTKKELSCNQTRNVRTAFVSYSELNDKDTLFGGEIMSQLRFSLRQGGVQLRQAPFFHRDRRFDRFHPARPEK